MSDEETKKSMMHYIKNYYVPSVNTDLDKKSLEINYETYIYEEPKGPIGFKYKCLICMKKNIYEDEIVTHYKSHYDTINDAHLRI